MQMKRDDASLSAIVLAIAIFPPAAFAKRYVYPAKGQNARQQQKDAVRAARRSSNERGFGFAGG